MIYFFYYTRNITGLILLISPLVGFLFIDFSFTLSMVFLCSLAAGMLLGALCYDCLNFRLWICIFCIACSAGAFLLHTGLLSGSGSQTSALSLIGLAFVGLYGGSLVSIVPSNILVSWFRASKAILTGTVLGISLALGTVFGIFMERHTYFALIMGLAAMVSGALFFLQQPPLFMGAPIALNSRLFQSEKRILTAKILFFMFSVSFAAGLALFNPPQEVPFDFFISPQQIFIFGLIAGSVLAGLLSEFKGIYSSCIFIIFLAEFSVFSPDMGSGVWPQYIHAFFCGMFPAAAAAIIPIAVYYIYGPDGYNRCLSKVWPALPLGIAAGGSVSEYFRITGAGALISHQTYSILLTILLVACFFTIFSAWKHRFILLK